MAPVKTTIETSVEDVRDAVVNAGFRPGRRVRVSVEYVDAKAARDIAARRIKALLDAHPLPPEFEGMSEDDIMAYADGMVQEVREQQHKQ